MRNEDFPVSQGPISELRMLFSRPRGFGKVLKALNEVAGLGKCLRRQLCVKGEERHANQLGDSCSSGAGVKRHAQPQEYVIASCEPS